ncbi:MAG: hypothetical protein QG670_1948 [Thermoproteota archaeon]|nr:hypothetical protein [Thermoproteota archaeon]
MAGLSRVWNSKRFRWMAIVILAMAILGVFAVRFTLFSDGTVPHTGFQLSDPKGDVSLSVGSSYPGMTDIVQGSLNVSGISLTVNLITADTVSSVGEEESVQWDVLLVFENDTDVFKTYSMALVMNSTGFYSTLQDVDSNATEPCNASFKGSTLVTQLSPGELSNATKIEWSITSTYQKYDASGELVDLASDSAPDKGLQTTNL